MNYEILKKEVNSISDPDLRARAYSRLQAQYHLDLAIRCLVMANTGKFPEPEVTNRLVSSVETLAAEFK